MEAECAHGSSYIQSEMLKTPMECSSTTGGEGLIKKIGIWRNVYFLTHKWTFVFILELGTCILKHKIVVFNYILALPDPI